MATNQALLSGGQLVVASLRAHGVEMAFGVAGESYLEVLDALFDAPEIRLVTCRQEGGAAFMAEAYGKLTGRPGVLLVTRGPGACNASIGIHTAFQDSTPMVVLVGQVARHQIDREAFQEVDFRKMFAPLAKWVAQIDMAERVPELINQAIQVATSGRPGPWLRHCRRTCCATVARPKSRDRTAPCAPAPGRPILPSCGGFSQPPNGRSCWSAAAAGATTPAAISQGLPRRTISRSAVRSAVRTSSTTACRVLLVILVPVQAPRSWHASNRLTSCLQWARGSARSLRNPIRCSTFPSLARCWSTSMPPPRSSAACSDRRWRSIPACPNLPPPRRRWRRWQRVGGRAGATQRARNMRPDLFPPGPAARSISAKSWDGCAIAFPTMRS